MIRSFLKFTLAIPLLMLLYLGVSGVILVFVQFADILFDVIPKKEWPTIYFEEVQYGWILLLVAAIGIGSISFIFGGIRRNFKPGSNYVEWQSLVAEILCGCLMSWIISGAVFGWFYVLLVSLLRFYIFQSFKNKNLLVKLNFRIVISSASTFVVMLLSIESIIFEGLHAVLIYMMATSILYRVYVNSSVRYV